MICVPDISFIRGQSTGRRYFEIEKQTNRHLCFNYIVSDFVGFFMEEQDRLFILGCADFLAAFGGRTLIGINQIRLFKPLYIYRACRLRDGKQFGDLIDIQLFVIEEIENLSSYR